MIFLRACRLVLGHTSGSCVLFPASVLRNTSVALSNTPVSGGMATDATATHDQWLEVDAAGKRIHLLSPNAIYITHAIGGNANGAGDAELHTWAIPWNSGLFAQLTHWDLTDLNVLDIGCGLGLAGCFACQKGASSVFFADRSEIAVGLALRSAAANLPAGAPCRIYGKHGCWSSTAAAAWPQSDLILGNEVLYCAEAVEQLTAIILSPVLRVGGVAAICGVDRGILMERLENSLRSAGLHVQSGNGFTAATMGTALQPSVLLLVRKPGGEGTLPLAMRSIAIRPKAWHDTGADRARLSPPACVMPSPLPAPPPPPSPPAAPPLPPTPPSPTPQLPPPCPPAAPRMHLLVTETPAEDVAERLERLESVRASRGVHHASWMAQVMIDDWGSAGSPSYASQLAATYVPNQPAAELGEPLRALCECLLDRVQAELFEQLLMLSVALEAAEATRVLRLQLCATLTVTRTPADAVYSSELVHADAFDGTVIGLAFLCTKMGTRIFEEATFVEAPLQQFVRESSGGMRNGFSRVIAGSEGASRQLKPRQLMILPAAVAHARPNGRVDAHAPLGPRWFVRAHLELRPAGGPKAWGAQQRMAVALLVLEHVWRDPSTLALAKDEVERAAPKTSS